MGLHEELQQEKDQVQQVTVQLGKAQLAYLSVMMPMDCKLSPIVDDQICMSGQICKYHNGCRSCKVVRPVIQRIRQSRISTKRIGEVTHASKHIMPFSGIIVQEAGKDLQLWRMWHHLTWTINEERLQRFLTGRNGRPIGLKIQVGEGIALSLG